MAYNSDGYIMIDFTEVDFRRTNQTIDGLYKRCVDVIGTNKFILVINANGRTPLPATCSFTNNQYVIDTCIYMFAISSNDNLFIRRNDVPASDIIDDSSISVDKTWSSNKIDTEFDGKQDTLTAGTNITIDENNVISATGGGGAVIDDNVIVNNKVWSSLNTVEMLAPINTVVGSPATFNTSLALPIVSCKTSFMATQEGTGDASTSNIRTLIPVEEIINTVNGVDTVIDLNGVRYGGNVDLVSGAMTVTYSYYKTTGNESMASYFYSNMNGVNFGSVLEYSMNRARYISNMSKFTGPTGAFAPGELRCGASSKGLFWIGILDVLNMTLDEFKVWIVSHPLELAYEIPTPFTVQLTPSQINTIVGNNSIASDAGAITVSYKALPIDLL